MFKTFRKYQLSYSRCYILIRRLLTTDATNNQTLKFENDFDATRIPVTETQRFLLGIGSSIMSLVNPRRADMIAIMGETTGIRAAQYMLNRMKEDPEGNRILSEKPRISSSTVDLLELSQLPEGTLGKKYFDFLQTNKVTPDSRDPVRFINNVELAYVIQRYREIHDLIHTILDMPTNMLGEVTVKWVEAYQTRLPLCVLGGLFGAVRLAPKQRQKYVKYHLPWAIETGMNSKFFMNVYFEKRWDQLLTVLLKELNIRPLVTSEYS